MRGQIRHGTHHAYCFHRCRCDVCRTYRSAYDRQYRQQIPRRRYTPRDDVDEVAVMRATRGDRSVRLNRAEERAAFMYLDGHGYPARAIAERVGVTERTVVRWRSLDRARRDAGTPRTPGEQAC